MRSPELSLPSSPSPSSFFSASGSPTPSTSPVQTRRQSQPPYPSSTASKTGHKRSKPGLTGPRSRRRIEGGGGIAKKGQASMGQGEDIVEQGEGVAYQVDEAITIQAPAAHTPSAQRKAFGPHISPRRSLSVGNQLDEHERAVEIIAESPHTSTEFLAFETLVHGVRQHILGLRTST